jgi:hypothetical protein
LLSGRYITGHCGAATQPAITRSNEDLDMARKASSGGVNKFEAIRNLLKENPTISAKEAIDALAAKGITVKQNLFYLVKGKMIGRNGRRRKATTKAVPVASSAPAKHSNALVAIRKVKDLSNEVGGLRTLKAIIDVLSE